MNHITCQKCSAKFTEENLKTYIRKAEEKRSQNASGGTIIQEVMPGVIYEKNKSYYMICPKCGKETKITK